MGWRVAALGAIGLALGALTPAQELVVSTHGTTAPEIVARVGDRLFVASWSTVTSIDLNSGLVILGQPQGSLVESIVPSPDGDLLAIGTCDHRIHLRRPQNLELVATIQTEHECTEAMAFTKGGAELVIGVYGLRPNNGIRVLSVAARRLGQLRPLTPGPRRVALTNDGRRLAVVDDKGTATLFSWPSLEVEKRFEGVGAGGYSGSALFFSPDGRYLGFEGVKGLKVFVVGTGEAIALPGARTAQVMDMPPGGPTRIYTEETVDGSAARFLNDGRLAYVSDSQLLLRRLPSGPTQAIRLPEPPVDWAGDVGMTHQNAWLLIDPDGRKLIGTLESTIRIFDTASKGVKTIDSFAVEDQQALAWNVNGTLALTSIGGTRLWDARLGARKRDLRVEKSDAFIWVPDGSRYVAADGDDVALVEAASGRLVASRPAAPFPRPSIAAQKGGARIVVSTPSALDVLDSAFRPTTSLRGEWGEAQAEHLAISGDGKWVAAGLGGRESSFRVWSTGTGKQATLESSHLTYGPQPPAFSPDSTLLATFVKGSSVVVWRVGTWLQTQRWTLPGTGRSLAFAPVGSTLAVADDQSLALWSSETAERLRTFAAPGSGMPRTVAWSPDGKYIVSGADDGVVRFWEASTARFVASLYLFEDGDDWVVVGSDGSFDGTDRAVSRAIAWKTANRSVLDDVLVRQRRQPGLWRSLFGGN